MAAGMRIRLFLREGGELGRARAICSGSFSGISPMRLGGQPCRALEAMAVLAADSTGKQRSPGVLFKSEDPDEIFFMDCSGGAPFGSVLGRMPECADWIYEAGSRAWKGRARGSSEQDFEAPLFAFWLLQAAICAQEGRHGHQEDPEWTPEGRKAAQQAVANLEWHWQVPEEDRLRMFHAAVNAAGKSLGSQEESRLAELTHPELAKLFCGIAPQAYSALAGSDLALRAIVESCELETAVGASSVGKPSGSIRI